MEKIELQENEELRDIPNYEGIYGCANMGRIYSIRYNRFLKGCCVRQGYLQIHFHIHKNRKIKYIHCLVAQIFIEKPDLINKYEVNHKNGIKSDNRIDNLETVTPSENVQHSFDTGLNIGHKGIKHPNSKLTEENIINIRKDNRTHKEISKDYGVSRSTITNIKNNINWKHIK